MATPLSPIRSRSNLPGGGGAVDLTATPRATAGQISKAAFFRSRSPPAAATGSGPSPTYGSLQREVENAGIYNRTDESSSRDNPYAIPPVTEQDDNDIRFHHSRSDSRSRHARQGSSDIRSEDPSMIAVMRESGPMTMAGGSGHQRSHSRGGGGSSGYVFPAKPVSLSPPDESEERTQHGSPMVTQGHGSVDYSRDGRESLVSEHARSGTINGHHTHHRNSSHASISGSSHGHKRASSRSQPSQISTSSASLNGGHYPSSSLSSARSGHRKRPSGYEGEHMISPKSAESLSSSMAPTLTMFTAQSSGVEMSRQPTIASPISPATTSSGAGASDDQQTMLLSLLAGQAVVDCSGMRVAAWDEVEAWKAELSVLAGRLAQQVARYQRETKILTAARTLAKLNEANKRLSRQSKDSLEQAEEKAAAAEKEMLVLRDREQTLRQSLNEHWAAVMAWEVRRLENTMQGQAAKLAQAEAEIRELRELRKLETVVQEHKERLKRRDDDLSKVKLQLADREDEVRTLANRYVTLEQKKDELVRATKAEQIQQQESQSKYKQDQERWIVEKTRMQQMLDKRGAESSIWDNARPQLAQVLGLERVDHVGEAVEAIKKLNQAIKRKDEELRGKEEAVREVVSGFEREVNKLAQDKKDLKQERDLLRSQSDEVTLAHASRVQQYESDMKAHRNRSVELEQEVRRLHAALETASAAQAKAPSPDQERSIANLRKELDTRDVLLEDLWTILPSPAARESTGLVELAAGNLKEHVASPSVDLNLESLRVLFSAPTDAERYGGIQALNERVRRVLDDGKLVTERAIRAGQERSILKSNAAKAQQLVQKSSESMAEYQK